MKKARSIKKPVIKQTYIMSGGGIIGSPASYAIPVPNTAIGQTGTTAPVVSN